MTRIVAAFAVLFALAGRRRRAGAHGQRLQLVRLYRPEGARGFHQGDRHQGRLRHLRQQRDPRDQAARRRVRLRHRRAVRAFPERADHRPASSRSSTSPSCRTCSNMWPEVTERLAAYDPGNEYAVNYMWGTTGIGYNVKKVQGALGAERRSTAGTSSSSRRSSPSSSRLRRPCARLARATSCRRR